jgi:HlyD family secretion protein
MKRKSIVIIFILLLAVVLVIVYYFFVGHTENAYAWKTTQVQQGKIVIQVKATGTINPDTTVEVGTQVTGTIWKLLADYNTVVKKGQVIAVIDTTFLSASRITALAALNTARANLKQAQSNYDRNKVLLTEEVIPQSDYENTETALAIAKAAVISALANLNHAKINLQYAVITSPVSGTVISRNVELGQTVVSSFNSPTLFTIANDLKKMQVQANVDEADIGQVKEGQEVTFTVDAYPDETFHGTIFQVRLQPVTVQNVVNYIVIINVENPGLKLMPGLTANISINVQEHDEILKVPANALTFMPPEKYLKNNPHVTPKVLHQMHNSIEENTLEDLGSTVSQTSGYVWLEKGNDIVPVQVKLGLSDGNYTEISGDIQKSDQVVTGINAGSIQRTGSNSPFMPHFNRNRNK